MPSAYKLLQFALAVFGVVMLLLYPLAVVWPSGWAWESGAPYQSHLFMMTTPVGGRAADTRRSQAAC